MRTNRKFTAILLSLVMAFSLLPVSVFAAAAEVTVAAPTVTVGNQGTDADGKYTGAITVNWAISTDNFTSGDTLADVIKEVKVKITSDAEGNTIVGGGDEQTISTSTTTSQAFTITGQNTDATLYAVVTVTCNDGPINADSSTDPTKEGTNYTAPSAVIQSFDFKGIGTGGSTPEDPKKDVTVAITEATQVKDGDTPTNKVDLTWTVKGEDLTDAHVDATAVVTVGNDEVNVTGTKQTDSAVGVATENTLTYKGQLTMPASVTAADPTISLAVKLTTDGEGKYNAPDPVTNYKVTYTVPEGGGNEEDPDPGTSTMTVSSYDYTSGALKVVYTGLAPETSYYVAIYKGNATSVTEDSTPVVEETAVQMTDGDGEGVKTAVFKPSVTLEAGNYCIMVRNGSEKGFGNFTVTAGGTTTPPATDEEIQSGLESIEGITESSTPAEVTTAIKEVVGATSNDEFVEVVESISEETAQAMLDVYADAGVTVIGTDAAGGETVSNKTLVLAAANAGSDVTTVAVVKHAAPATTHETPSEYSAGVSFAIDLKFNGNNYTSTLTIPVIVTWKIPSSFGSGALKVLHYKGSSYETINAKREGGNAVFECTSFSDFQLVEVKSGTSTPTDPTNPGTPSTPGSSNTPHKGGSSGGGSSAKPATSTTPTTPNNGGTTVTTTPTQVFKDIPANHWASAQIKWAYDNKCMNGTGDGAFTPNGTVTRQALWMVLARLAGSNPADMAAAKAWAVENSISDGTTPSGAVSRQQLVTILYRFAQMMAKDTQGAAELSSYPDAASVASYAQDALAWAVGNGIVSGTSDGRLNPEGSATRAQFAVILYRFYNGEQAQ